MENKQRGMAFLEKHRLYTEKMSYIVEQMFCSDRMLGAAKEQFGEEDLRYVRLLKEKKEMAFRYAALEAHKEVIEETVRRLPPPERKVIERFFLTSDRRFAAEDLMESLEFEKTHIYRLRDRALRHLGEILEGEEHYALFTELFGVE